MTGQKNRIQVTGWHKRHDLMLTWLFENMPDGYRHLYADEKGKINQSAMVRRCVEEHYRAMLNVVEVENEE